MGRARRSFALFALLALTPILALPAIALTVERVDETDLGVSWFALDEKASTGGNGTVTFVVGPSTVPLGDGSARFSTDDAADGPALLTGDLAGTPMASVTELSYWTYRHTSSSAPAHLLASLQFGFDKEGDGLWDGRLVFEQVYQPGATVVEGVWQEWDAYHDGEAIWWMTRANFPFCAFSCFVTWDAILAAYPNAELLEAGFKAGSGWSGSFVGNVDEFTFGAGTDVVVYNFEHGIANKESCKQGSWKVVTDPSYRNQGDCVSGFARAQNPHNPPGKAHGHQ
ncbi:MAG: hypothetical protein ACT4OP_06915 [Actinomycetota bacterium]